MGGGKKTAMMRVTVQRERSGEGIVRQIRRSVGDVKLDAKVISFVQMRDVELEVIMRWKMKI